MNYRAILICLLIQAVCLPNAIVAQTTTGSTVASSPTGSGQTTSVFTYQDKAPPSSAGFATILLDPSMPDQIWPLTFNTDGGITVAVGSQPDTNWGFSADDAAHWRNGTIQAFNGPDYLYPDFSDYYINGFNGKGWVSADAWSGTISGFHESTESFVACWSPASEDPLAIKGPTYSDFNPDDSRYTFTSSDARMIGFGNSMILAMELTMVLESDGYFHGTSAAYLYLGISGSATEIETSSDSNQLSLESVWSVVYDINSSGAYIGRMYTPATGMNGAKLRRVFVGKRQWLLTIKVV